MSDVFAIVQVGLLAGQERLNAVSGNAASATLPGYRRQVAALNSFAGHFAPATAQAAAAPAEPVLRRGVDLRAGQMMATGKPLDVAIDGAQGFFALSDGQRTFLTRAGSFRVDAEGYLVGERGLRVQGSNGDIRLGSADVSVRETGEIVQREEVQAVLQLFTLAEGAQLSPDKGSLLAVDGALQPVDSGRAAVRSGFLEGSNAGGPQDMLALMALTRQFESLVKVTQGYDEVLGRAIQKLGEI
ncbi:flagellar hook-basal body complex protein [Eleftheria terrae]|uniref:flagellar hook-basal body complex protein n=1 Tax=Eleftheria terrae TaxID=1597781 RepID=UPI00263AB273|nr:flagellar hook-basal body complex protein [Eleftheria terrae]WKB51646.1 flagellar hook-basal body complex protein [Eleftheria terrae]